jgi:RND family efflux transporter MFP subunit
LLVGQVRLRAGDKGNQHTMLRLYKFGEWFRRRGILGAVLLALAVGGCGHHAEEHAPAGPPVVPAVQVVAVAPQDCPQTIKVQGSLLGDEHAVVGVKVAGRVDRVEVDLGTQVKRGDRLAVLDLDDFEVRIKHARAELASVRARLGLKPGQGHERLDRTKAPAVVQEKALLDGAQAEYDRAVVLEQNNALAAEEVQLRYTTLRVAQARYRAALHQVDEQVALLEMYANTLTLAEHALADATVTAPFDGIVAARHVAPGVYLQVGDPVITLVRTNPLRFHAGVPEAYALRVKRDQTVSITIEGHAAPLLGKVSRISPVLNLASRSLPIEVDVPNPDLQLRAGLFAEAEIVVNPRATTLAVPRSAVIEFAGVEKVYVVEGGKAIPRRVVAGRALGNRVEIVEGLRAGEQVAVNGKDARPGPVTLGRLSPPAAKGEPGKHGGQEN